MQNRIFPRNSFYVILYPKLFITKYYLQFVCLRRVRTVAIHDFVLAGNHAHRVRGRVEELRSIGGQFDGNRTALARLQFHTTKPRRLFNGPSVSPTLRT